jgi:ABC-2 type transport system permease protein
MRRYLGLYCLFLVQRLKVLMEYRVNFLIGASSTVLLQAAGLLAIWVVMRQVPDINGWTFDEILLVYGLLTLAKSINHMFADNLWTLGGNYIRTGAFDRFLVRPIDPLFHLLADRFCHDGIGNFAVGLVLVIRSTRPSGSSRASPTRPISF